MKHFFCAGCFLCASFCFRFSVSPVPVLSGMLAVLFYLWIRHVGGVGGVVAVGVFVLCIDAVIHAVLSLLLL